MYVKHEERATNTFSFHNYKVLASVEKQSHSFFTDAIREDTPKILVRDSAMMCSLHELEKCAA
jgi:hypothetical protein